MIVPEYFKDDELSCKCGCGLVSPLPVALKLYAVRLIMGIPIIVNSAIRCHIHNANVGGINKSSHLPAYNDDDKGTGAFDIVLKNKTEHRKHEWRLIQVCQFVGFTGIGIKNNRYLHVDDRHKESVVWAYA